MAFVSVKIKQQVFARANFLCEYCCSPAEYSAQPFAIEHILPISKGGSDNLENLACACGGCNGHKYNKTEAFDPNSSVLVPIFNPREMIWAEHFIWSSDFRALIGLSDIGRATISILYLNRKEVSNLRKLLIMEGIHPPF